MIDVTFLTDKGHMDIRLVEQRIEQVAQSARTLNAKYFVMAHDHDMATRRTFWGVFDPWWKDHEGKYGADLLKSVAADTPDAAVMWAELRGAR